MCLADAGADADYEVSIDSNQFSVIAFAIAAAGSNPII